jgi:hypothetical protein
VSDEAISDRLYIIATVLTLVGIFLVWYALAQMI